MRRTPLILAVYAALALVFTYPLVTRLGTHTPGGEAWTYDGFAMVWNVWWFKRALLELNSNPFFTDALFAPLGADLYLHTFTVLTNLLALPLLAWLSPVVAVNALLLASLALCAYGMYLLALHVLPGGGASRAGAFVAGLIYAFSSQRFMFLALGHTNFFATPFVPFFMLYALKAMRSLAPRQILMAALFLALCLLNELSLAMMAVLFAGLYWVMTRLAQRRAGDDPEPVAATLRGALALAASVAAMSVMTLPYLAPVLRETFDARYLAQGWGGAPVTSVDVAGMFVPSSLHPLLGSGDWPREWQLALTNKARFGSVNTFYPGLGVLALALLGAAAGWHRRAAWRARPWLWVALTFIVLSWGPILHINGLTRFDLDGMPVTVGLPYIVLHYIPLLNGLRIPQRFGGMATLALAVLAGYGVMWLAERMVGVRQRGRGERGERGFARVAPIGGLALAGLAALVLGEHLLAPLPLHDARIPSVYAAIAAEEGNFTVMDIPLGWRSGFGPIGTENTQLQYYQTAHGKRLISGFAARTPAFQFEYFQRHPILNAFAVQESEGRLPAVAGARDGALAAELAYFYDLRYIIVHPPADAPTPYDATRHRVNDYVIDVFDVDVVSKDAERTVYRVNQPAPRASLTMDFGTVSSALNRGEGWGADELIAGASANWLTDAEARVFVPLRLPGDYRLTLRAAPFAYAGRPPQTLALRVNGHATGATVTLADGWGEYEITLPAAMLTRGLNEVTLMPGASASPAEVVPGSDDRRRLSVAVDWVRVEVQ